ncbi:glutathione S-transferase T3-like [Raphanus sativus]|uniref:Glutathione S-transferase T3-like n=1 Tax=Raphanus sativus TaxID=3726 RepID=A0A6J0JJM3_RAPSA|nr:glutathione S-transferase T3-like [Raphanus sativus]
MAESPPVPKAAERRKWSPKEDIVLISAWLNTSKDPIVSTNHKGGAFWKRIQEYYNGSPQLSGFAPRELNQCKQRWGRLNEQVCRFVGSHEAALKEQASGQNENDVMKAAHDIFLNDYGSKFGLEHAWRELRYDQKWKSNSKDGAKEKRKEGAEVEPEFEEVRPEGVKAAKRKKRGNEAYDQLQTMLGVKDAISKRRLLERLLARKDPLSETEMVLKDKLVSELVVTGLNCLNWLLYCLLYCFLVYMLHGVNFQSRVM